MHSAETRVVRFVDLERGVLGLVSHLYEMDVQAEPPGTARIRRMPLAHALSLGFTFRLSKRFVFSASDCRVQLGHRADTNVVSFVEDGQSDASCTISLPSRGAFEQAERLLREAGFRMESDHSP